MRECNHNKVDHHLDNSEEHNFVFWIEVFSFNREDNHHIIHHHEDNHYKKTSSWG